MCRSRALSNLLACILVTICCAVACACAFICALALVPAQTAYAQPTYTVEELTTDVEILPDASAKVVLRQVFDFSEPNEGFVWYLGAPSNGESYKITRISAAPVDDGGAYTDGWVRLQNIDVNMETQGEWPGDVALPEMREQNTQPWYSYNISDGMVRCWFPAEPGRYVLEVHYTITNCVNVYRDVAELDWRYVHASYPAAINDITLQVTLPVPANVTVKAGSDVYAWGHGPEAGYFRVNEDGTVIYHIDSLEEARSADAHIIFPASWMTEMYAGSPRLYTETQKAEILLEESTWVDAWTRQQNWDFEVRILFGAIAAVVLLIGVIGVLRFGFTLRARRLLIRIAAILGCIGLAVSLFFWEPLTELCLFGLAGIIAILSLFFPKNDVPESGDE